MLSHETDEVDRHNLIEFFKVYILNDQDALKKFMTKLKSDPTKQGQYMALLNIANNSLTDIQRHLEPLRLHMETATNNDPSLASYNNALAEYKRMNHMGDNEFSVLQKKHEGSVIFKVSGNDLFTLLNDTPLSTFLGYSSEISNRGVISDANLNSSEFKKLQARFAANNDKKNDLILLMIKNKTSISKFTQIDGEYTKREHAVSPVIHAMFRPDIKMFKDRMINHTIVNLIEAIVNKNKLGDDYWTFLQDMSIDIGQLDNIIPTTSAVKIMNDRIDFQEVIWAEITDMINGTIYKKRVNSNGSFGVEGYVASKAVEAYVGQSTLSGTPVVVFKAIMNNFSLRPIIAKEEVKLPSSVLSLSGAMSQFDHGHLSMSNNSRISSLSCINVKFKSRNAEGITDLESYMKYDITAKDSNGRPISTTTYSIEQIRGILAFSVKRVFTKLPIIKTSNSATYVEASTLANTISIPGMAFVDKTRVSFKHKIQDKYELKSIVLVNGEPVTIDAVKNLINSSIDVNNMTINVNNLEIEYGSSAVLIKNDDNQYYGELYDPSDSFRIIDKAPTIDINLSSDNDDHITVQSIGSRYGSIFIYESNDYNTKFLV